MQKQIIEYFEQEEIIPLSEIPRVSWEEAHQMAPRLTKGWYELCRLDAGVRFEFIRDYWFNSLPYHPHTFAFIDRFFARVKDVPMFVLKQEIFLAYVLKDDSTFFFGRAPLIDQEIESFKKRINFPLPETFLKFYRIHNGFIKAGDRGELLSTEALLEEEKRFKNEEILFKCGEEVVESKNLLPFYQFFSFDAYQCFYREWVPDQEVGNVCCLLKDKAIADYRKRDEKAFLTFIDWLSFYMEDR